MNEQNFCFALWELCEFFGDALDFSREDGLVFFAVWVAFAVVKMWRKRDAKDVIFVVFVGFVVEKINVFERCEFGNERSG